MPLRCVPADFDEGQDEKRKCNRLHGRFFKRYFS